MQTSIVVLAAGEGSRSPTPAKWKLEVNGETLLQRTARLCDSKGQLYVAVREPIVDFGLRKDPQRILVRNSNCTCDTLWRSAQEIKGRMVVLLGDVYYTEKTMNAILDCGRSFCVFTDGQDIFALAMFRGDPMVAHARYIAGLLVKPNNGRLWEAYRKRVGDKGEGIPPLPNYLRYIVGDETQDFDTQEEYDNFKRGISKNKLQAEGVRVRKPDRNGEAPRVLEVHEMPRHRGRARQGRTRLVVETP